MRSLAPTDSLKLTGHSARVGCASSMHSLGISTEKILYWCDWSLNS